MLLPSLVLRTVGYNTGFHCLSQQQAHSECSFHKAGPAVFTINLASEAVNPKDAYSISFFPFSFFFLFVYLSLAVLGLRCCSGLSLAAASALLWFWSEASRAHGLSSCSQRSLGCLPWWLRCCTSLFFLLNFLFCVEVELISSAVMVSVPCVSADVEAVARVRLCVLTAPALPGDWLWAQGGEYPGDWTWRGDPNGCATAGFSSGVHTCASQPVGFPLTSKCRGIALVILGASALSPKMPKQCISGLCKLKHIHVWSCRLHAGTVGCFIFHVSFPVLMDVSGLSLFNGHLIFHCSVLSTCRTRFEGV